jgi:hypothetical protein
MVQRWKRSGLSRREFARRHHRALPTLHNWIAQQTTPRLKRGGMTQFFRELALPTAPTAPAPTRWAVELVRPDGIIVRATSEAAAAWVGALCREAAC